MKMRLNQSLLVLLCLPLFLVSYQTKSQCPTTNALVSPYNSNNGQRGCMFDVTATNDVTVYCISSNTYAGTTGNYEIYYKNGTHVGFEGNTAAWTFLGGATGVVSAGNNLPTYLPITFNVPILTGQTVAFYVTNDFGAGTSYTDGTAVGNFLASDANLTIYEGVGKTYPFGLTFNVRNFNGHLHYNLGTIVLPIELLHFEAESNDNNVHLNWTTATEQNNNFFTIERSIDGAMWDKILEVPAVGFSSSIQNYSAIDNSPLNGTSYYRLAQTDYDGNQSYSDVEVVHFQNHETLLNISPNPSDGHLFVSSNNLDCGVLSIFNAVGQRVCRLDISDKLNQHCNLNHLPNGIYTVVLNHKTGLVSKRLVLQKK